MSAESEVLYMVDNCARHIEKGIYRHFKGRQYEVLNTARHTETQEWLVVYRQLYDDYSLWVRPLSMFVEEVEHEGRIQPRFAKKDSSV